MYSTYTCTYIVHCMYNYHRSCVATVTRWNGGRHVYGAVAAPIPYLRYSRRLHDLEPTVHQSRHRPSVHVSVAQDNRSFSPANGTNQRREHVRRNYGNLQGPSLPWQPVGCDVGGGGARWKEGETSPSVAGNGSVAMGSE